MVETLMRRCLVCALLLLWGCANEDASQPLTGVYVFELFYGRTMEATTPDGTRYLYRFERTNMAQKIGATSEYVHWYTDPETGLCLQDYGAQPVCAEVYQLNVAHFRWGNTLFADLTVHEPAFSDRFGLPGR
jgi:hypothetical protein